jgi:alpha-D-ribose 1-methylphosphonate 5-triphosphate synthase subunit PhnH
MVGHLLDEGVGAVGDGDALLGGCGDIHVVGPLPEGFAGQVQANRGRFPSGVDVFFASGW